MNGPTEREQRWASARDIGNFTIPCPFCGAAIGEPCFGDKILHYQRLRWVVAAACMAEADRESATLRARVAVLEQQIAAIVAWHAPVKKTISTGVDAWYCSACPVAESATLRARVAVLEQQIAAIEALFAGGPDTTCRTTWREDESRPECSAASIECVEVPMTELRAALAAGVVDNPTEDEANADPFTLDDLGHPTEGSPS